VSQTYQGYLPRNGIGYQPVAQLPTNGADPGGYAVHMQPGGNLVAHTPGSAGAWAGRKAIRRRSSTRSAVLVLAATLPLLAATGTAASGRQAEDAVKPVFAGPIPNIPGKSLKTVEVSYAPGGRSGAHRHAKSAFIYAYVLEGAIRSQVEGEPVHVFRAGESWTEAPGAHHVVSENASKTKPARLLAVFIVDTDDAVLTTPDPH